MVRRGKVRIAGLLLTVAVFLRREGGIPSCDFAAGAREAGSAAICKECLTDRITSSGVAIWTFCFLTV